MTPATPAVEATPEGYCAVRALTEAIAEPLSAEDQTAQSMPDVSPTKWHRAHTTWFFEEFVLCPNIAGYRVFDPSYRFLFNSYYEAVGARHPRSERGAITRPGAAEVGAYRRHVDDAMNELLYTDLDADVLALVELGLHHEQQHQELVLMDAKHVLSRNVLDPVYRPSTVNPGATNVAEVTRVWIEHDGGPVEIGHAGEGFAFDNEAPRHVEHLAPFALASRLVTAGEVMAFIADDGYRRPELWLSDGWATVESHGWRAPLYWRDETAGAWSLFTLGGRRAVQPDEPVCHVSYYEADAIARWSGARLPTEAEWEALATEAPGSDATFDLDLLHPRASCGDGTVEQLAGEVWQWTASAYLPYPGFRTAPGAVGEYNGKFMVGQHVLRGGACITPPGHVRTTYRNFFPPAARWPFTGLRLARDLETR